MFTKLTIILAAQTCMLVYLTLMLHRPESVRRSTGLGLVLLIFPVFFWLFGSAQAWLLITLMGLGSAVLVAVPRLAR